MSIDYSKELKFNINNFKGQNNYFDSTKISPEEFITLQNVNTRNGSMESSIRYGLGESAPVPTSYSGDNRYIVNYNQDLTSAAFNFTPTANYEYAFKVTGITRVIEDMISFLIFFKVEGSTTIEAEVREDNSGTPGTIRSNNKINFTAASAENYGIWRAFNLSTTTALSDPFWVTFKTTGNITIFCENTQRLSRWKVFDTSSWVGFDTIHAGKNTPTIIHCNILNDSSDVQTSYVNRHVLYHSTRRANVQTVNINHTITDTGGQNISDLLSTVDFADHFPNFNRDIIIDTNTVSNRLHPTSTSIRQFIPRTNIIVSGGIVAATVPGAEYCVPLTFTYSSYYEDEAHSTSSYRDGYIDDDRFSTEVFDTKLIIAHAGSNIDHNKPCYIDLSSDIFVKAFTSTVPDSPKKIINYENTLWLVNTKGYPFRAWYSITGEFDSFASDQYENFSIDKEIIDVRKVATGLLVFLANEIKFYQGVPSAAALRFLSKIGIRSHNHIVTVKDFVFFMADMHLYIYNGAITIVTDLTDKVRIQQKDKTITNMAIFSHPAQNSIYICVDSDLTTAIVYNYVQQTFRTVTPNTTYGGVYYAGLNSLLLLAGWPFEYVNPLSSGNTYSSAIEVESGWIDPLLQIEKKHFDRIILEATPTTGSITFNLLITFDDGSTVSENGIDLQGIGSLVQINKRLDIEASKFQYKITAAAQNEQIKIHKIKIIYSPTVNK